MAVEIVAVAAVAAATDQDTKLNAKLERKDFFLFLILFYFAFLNALFRAIMCFFRKNLNLQQNFQR